MGDEPAKRPAKKSTVKKAAPAKKAPAKKTTTKKTAAKKTAAKKTAAKKTPAKKTAAKKTPAKKTTATRSAPAKTAPPAEPAAPQPPPERAPVHRRPSTSPLATAGEDVRALVRLVAAYRQGTYREVPPAKLALIAAGLGYVASPVDLVPEFVPGGFLDDLLVLGLVVRVLKTEVDRFRRWEERQLSAKKLQ